jgi:hypothetical protein
MPITKDIDMGPPIDLAKRPDIIEIEIGETPKTTRQVIEELNKRLKEEGCYETRTFGWNELRKENTDRYYAYSNDPWPGAFCTPPLNRAARMACYPMRGGSEGYWVDIIALYPPDPNEHHAPRTAVTVACHKCHSWQEAYEIATLTAQLLDFTD